MKIETEDKIDKSGHMRLDQNHLRKISNHFLKDMLNILYLIFAMDNDIGIFLCYFLGKQALH